MKLRCQCLPTLLQTISQLEESTGADFSTSSRRSLEKYVAELTSTTQCRSQRSFQPLFQDRQSSAGVQERRLLGWDGTPHIVVMTEYRWCWMRAPRTTGRNRTEPVALVHRSRAATARTDATAEATVRTGGGTGCSACVAIKAVIRFPQYRLRNPNSALQSLIAHRLRYLMSRGQFPGEVWYYAYYPHAREHNHELLESRQQIDTASMAELDPYDDEALITLNGEGRPVAKERQAVFSPDTRKQHSSRSMIVRQLDMVDCVVRSETSFLALLHRLELQLMERCGQSKVAPSSGTSASSKSVYSSSPVPINWLGVDLDDDQDDASFDEEDEDANQILEDMEAASEAGIPTATASWKRCHRIRARPSWKALRGRPLKDPLLPRRLRLTADEILSICRPPSHMPTSVTKSMVERLEAAEAKISRLEGRVERLTELIGCDPSK